MKNFLISLLQKIFGLKNYLFVTSIIKIKRKKIEPLNRDFFYFLYLLKEDYNALDIGANTGIMTYYLSKRLTNGCVFAFEPIIESFNNINKLVKFYRLKNVKSFNCALGAEEKIITMNMPVFHNYKAHTYSYVMQNNYYYNNENVISYQVKQERLDDLELSHK